MPGDEQAAGESFWNYRLMRHQEGGETTYVVHEVFYESSKVKSWTKGLSVQADHRVGILRELAHMVQAYGMPVLDFETGLEVEPAIDIKGEIHEAGATLNRAAGKTNDVL